MLSTINNKQCDFATIKFCWESFSWYIPTYQSSMGATLTHMETISRNQKILTRLTHFLNMLSHLTHQGRVILFLFYTHTLSAAKVWKNRFKVLAAVCRVIHLLQTGLELWLSLLHNFIQHSLNSDSVQDLEIRRKRLSPVNHSPKAVHQGIMDPVTRKLNQFYTTWQIDLKQQV